MSETSVPATVDPTGSDLVEYDPSMNTGLEDFETTDLVMPRINIVQNEALFKDNLTGETFSSMECVILGLIKQRILWDADVDEGEKPLCKSYDFKIGNPDPNRFPWNKSGFDKAAFDGDPQLPCGGCVLKDWGTHPQRDTPWCSEQHTFPILQKVEGGYAPALLTLQRSGIKPSRAYLSAFARQNTPLFTVFTTISLDAQKRGQVNYATPKFAKGEPTDRALWGEWAEQYRQIRGFVTTRPAPREEEDSEPSTGVAAPEASAPRSAPTTPSVPSVPAQPAPAGDDLPF